MSIKQTTVQIWLKPPAKPAVWEIIPGPSHPPAAFGYTDKYDWLFIPSESNGTDKKPVGDIYWQNAAHNGWMRARLGGRWSNGSDAGPFCWSTDTPEGSHSRHTNGRLLYIPSDSQNAVQHIRLSS